MTAVTSPSSSSGSRPGSGLRLPLWDVAGGGDTPWDEVRDSFCRGHGHRGVAPVTVVALVALVVALSAV